MMYLKNLSILLLSYCLVSLSHCGSNTRFPNKTPAVLGDFPHMGLIGWRDGGKIQYNCVGSLISEKFILTAAHCTFNHNIDGDPDVVLLGAINAASEGPKSQKIAVKSVHKHPDRTYPKRYNDIGLIQLKESARFDAYVKPACLSKESEVDFNLLIGSGWELFDNGPNGGLKKFSITKSRCDSIKPSNRLPEGLAEYHMCANNINMASGSMLQTVSKTVGCKYDVFAFVAFGSRVDEVYIKTKGYNDWISKTMREV